MEILMKVFAYLKKYKNRRNIVYSRDPPLLNGKYTLDIDFTKILKYMYPDTAEELDVNLPEPLLDKLDITAFSGLQL